MRLIKGFHYSTCRIVYFYNTIFLYLFHQSDGCKSCSNKCLMLKRSLAEISDLQNWKHWHPVFNNDSANIKFNTADRNQ